VPGGTAANSGHPFVVAVAPVPAESLVDFRLALTAGTYSTACYFTIALDGVTGIAGPKPAAPRTGLGRIGPNPMTRSGRVSYSLARAAIIDLALYDATGRRAVTIARGHARPGSYSASVPAAGLPAGVYFCRLAVTGGALSERFTQKVQLAR